MKVLAAIFNSESKKRIMEAVAPLNDAYAKLSPGAVREASRAFALNIKALGISSCVLTEDEWNSTISCVRRSHSDFRADFVLAEEDVISLSQVVSQLPPRMHQLVSLCKKEDSGIVWLPLDEEVLDGTGL